MSRRAEKLDQSPQGDAPARGSIHGEATDPAPRAGPIATSVRARIKERSTRCDQRSTDPSTTATSAISDGSGISHDRERMRGRIALALIRLLAFVIVLAFLGLLTEQISVRDLKELLIFLGPLIALVGTATGFYFGGSAQK